MEAQKKQEIAEGDIKWVDWNRFGQRPQYPGVLPNGQEEDWSKKELSDSQKRRIWELKTNILPDVIRVLKGDLESWGSPPFHFFPWNRYVPVDPLIGISHLNPLSKQKKHRSLPTAYNKKLGKVPKATRG